MAEIINKDFLEGNGNFDSKENVALDVIKDADAHYATIEDLENVVEMPVIAEEQKTLSLSQRTWAKLDVNLGEMVKNVFETSERLFFIVCDDNVVYLNKKAQTLLEIDDFQQNSKESFFNFVDPQDWNLLADNIGGMLMEQKNVTVRLKTFRGRVIPLSLSAVYLPDTSHFSFILIGYLQQKTEKGIVNPLYDAATGLPNFFLFEDRLQMTINMEKDKPQAEINKIAVMALSIDNLEVFKSLQAEDVLYKKLAYQLVLALDKKCTVARGLKYPFWFLLPLGTSEAALSDYIAKIKNVLDAGISDNFNKHDIAYSLGTAVFPMSAPSAKKLVQLTIQALEQAKEKTGNKVVKL